MMFRSTLLLGASVLVGACQTSVPPRQKPPYHFVVDSASYHARPSGRDPGITAQFRVVARFRNITRDTVFLVRCDPSSRIPAYTVLGADSFAWPASAYSPEWACVGGVRPLAVAPGAERLDTLLLSGPNAWKSGTGEPVGAFEGRFRLYYDVQTCHWAERCPSPHRQIGVSAPFHVRLLDRRGLTRS